MPVEHSPQPVQATGGDSGIAVPGTSGVSAPTAHASGSGATAPAPASSSGATAPASSSASLNPGTAVPETSGKNDEMDAKKANKKTKKAATEGRTEVHTRSKMQKTGKVYNPKSRLFETPKTRAKRPSAARAKGGRAMSSENESDETELVSTLVDSEDLAPQTVKKAPPKKTAARRPKSARVAGKSKAPAKGKTISSTKSKPKRGANKGSKNKESERSVSFAELGDSGEIVAVEGESMSQAQKDEVLNSGENSFVELRNRLRDFLNYLQTNYETELHDNEAKQMKEIRKELGSLCYKHCYLRGRALITKGDATGMVLTEAYDQLANLLIQIDHQLGLLTQNNSEESVELSTLKGRASRTSKSKRSPGSRKQSKRNESFSSNSDSSDDDWEPTDIKARRRKKKVHRKSESSRQKQSTPKQARRRLDYRDGDLLLSKLLTRGSGGPSSSPSSSEDSSTLGSCSRDVSLSRSVPSLTSDSSESSSGDSDSDLKQYGSSSEEESSEASRENEANRSKRRTRSQRKYKKAKQRYRYSPPVKRHTREHKKRRNLLDSILGGGKKKRRSIPHYLAPGGEGRRFYKRLPPPWNVVPTRQSANFAQVATLQKSGLIPVFDGTIGGYLGFRTQFKMSIHEVDLSILAKFMFLRNALAKVPELKTLLDIVPAGASGYALLIQRLEDKYGGEERMLTFHLEQLKKVPLVHSGDVAGAEALYDAVNSYRAALSEAGSRDHSTHSYFSFVKNKLSHSLKLKYSDYCSVRGVRRPQDIKYLIKWLYRCVILPLGLDPAPVRRGGGQIPPRNRGRDEIYRAPELRPEGQKKLHKMAQEGGRLFAASGRLCPLCQGEHSLPSCKKFLDMEVPDRREIVGSLKVCFRCLELGHMNANCQSSFCKVCNKNHHELTHGPTREYLNQRRANNPVGTSPNNRPLGRGKQNLGRGFLGEGEDELQVAYRQARGELPRDKLPNSEQGTSMMYQSLSAIGEVPAVSLQFVPVLITNLKTGKSTYVPALLDGGSNMTVCSQRLSRVLGGSNKTYPLSIMGINGHVVHHETELLSLTFSDKAESFQKHVVVRTLPSPAGDLNMVDWNLYKGDWPHLRDLCLPVVPDNLQVELIIGNDQPYFHRTLSERVGRSPDEPVGRLTPLGWTVGGPVRSSHLLNEAEVTAAPKCMLQKGCPSGGTAVPKCPSSVSAEQLTPEDCMIVGPRPRPPVLNTEDRRCLGLLKGSLNKLANGHYEVGVLWKGKERPPNNKYKALSSWTHQLSRLEKDETKRESYEKVVQGWVDSGYMERLPDSAFLDAEAFYLEHFPVYKQSAETTKCRVVMNGRAEFKGVSLNDFIEKGPKLLNDLAHVLLRFRRFRVALSGDIREMFLRVRLLEEDCKYHRIFYTFRREGNVCILEAKVHQFGNRGSPVTVVFVIKWIAFEFRDRYPLASETVLESSLVDDCMDSVPTDEMGEELVKGLKAIFASCGMEIHKWVCSSPGVALPGESRKGFELRDPELEGEFPKGKALGISYDARLDQFRFQAPTPPSSTVWTRRMALSFYMGVFDPKGMILPVLMEARMLFQETWQATSDWNSGLSTSLNKRWNKWGEQLAGLPALRFERWLRLEKISDKGDGLHVFCDASKKAFGCVAYLVTKGSSVLVMSKGKLHHREGHAINIAELESARLSVKLARKLCGVLKLPPERCFFWTDSTTVLCWVKAPGKALPYFVARVSAYIRDSSITSHWRHVDTKSNPADLISRGCSVEVLRDSDLWMRGPRFLIEGDWPPIKIPVAPVVSLPREHELAQLIGIFVLHEPEGVNPQRVATALPPLSEVSSFLRGLRVMEHVVTFLGNLCVKSGKGPLSVDDGLLAWLRLDQKHYFKVQCERLSSGQEHTIEGWRGYDITWEHGVIHLGGRTGRPPVPLLDRNSHLALLWAKKIHTLDLRHIGGAMTLKSESRAHFWVFKGSSMFKKVVRTCVQCVRARPFPLCPRMGNLPAFRLDDSRCLAFEHVGIDFGGPWGVTVYSDKKQTLRVKKYLLLICCSVYRAVCCIATEGRTTNDVALGLQEFASRYRVPSHIHSDNAAEFVKLANEFRDLGARNQIQLPLSPQWGKVQWTFSHPVAPHSNGLTESLIGVTKRAISHALHNAPLTSAVFRTALTFAENLVNRRPIGNLSEDPNDPEPLTPGMFIGQQFAHFDSHFHGKLSGSKYVEQWKLVVRLQEKFAARFFRELTPELEKRAKWWDLLPEIAVDQVVIVLNCPPTEKGQWPLGRVECLRRGRDGVIRGAWVRVGGTSYLRHMRHLVPLM